MHMLKFASSIVSITVWTTLWTLIWARTTDRYDHRRDRDDVFFLVLGTWIVTVFVAVLVYAIWTVAS